MSEETEIPDGWKWAPLESIAETSTGGTPSRRRPDYFGGDIPWVKSGELGDSIVTDTDETLTQDGLRSSSAKLFPEGTLCIALYGATVGKLGILGLDATTNQAVCGIFLPTQMSTRFVYYYLMSIRGVLIRKGKGGAQSNISNTIVRETRLPIPPANEQRRIVAKIEELFSDLDAGVAALERAKANLKRYRAAVLKAAVEGKLTEQWRAENPDVEPASELLERILAERRERWEAEQLAKYEEKGKKPPKGWEKKYKDPAEPDVEGLPELPEGWCWATVGQLANDTQIGLDRGKSQQNDDPSGSPYIKMSNVTMDGRVSLVGLVYVPASDEERESFSVEPGDLLFNTRNSSELVGKVGLVREVPSNTVFNNNLMRVRTSLDSRWLCFSMSSIPFRFRMNLVKKATTNVAAIYAKDLLTLPVAVPPIDEQRVLSDELDRVFSLSFETERLAELDLRRSSRLRQSILKRAFKGKLVPQDPDDEPASELLARIKAERESAEGNGKKSRTRRKPRKGKQ